MNYKLSITATFLLLFLLTLIAPQSVMAASNHWFTTVYGGSETKLYDVIADASPKAGGSGLIYAVGHLDGSPVIVAFNPDGTLNWSKKYNVMGFFTTVTKRIGVFAPPDQLLFVGGTLYTPRPMSILLVVNSTDGSYIDGWTLSTPGFENDKVNDLIIGPDGAVYGVGAVFTNIDPSSPFNTLFFRYDSGSMNVTYSLVYESTTEGHALDTFNDRIYSVETRGDDMYLREINYVNGNDLRLFKISHNQGFNLLPNDLLVMDGKAYIVGGISQSSMLFSMDLNGTPLTLYSHVETFWSNIELGENDRLYLYGDSKNFKLDANDTSRNLLFISYFNASYTGTQNVDVYVFGGSGNDFSGGFDINNFGYVSGYTDSFPYQGVNISGFTSLVSPNMTDFMWTPDCRELKNVTVIVRKNVFYLNLVNNVNVTNGSLGNQGVNTGRIGVEVLDFRPGTCLAYDMNNPVIISEFNAIAILILAFTAFTILRKYVKKHF